MGKQIRILHLEDLSSDAELVYRALKKGNLKFVRLVVDNKAKFTKALKEFLPDIILSDHSLPSFNSHEALVIFKKANLKIPFILITATMSEDFAVDVIKRGADDYILKDRLERLPTALTNAMDKYRLVRNYQKKLDEIFKNEKHFRALIENSSDAKTLISKRGEWVYQSPAVERLTGFPFKDLKGVLIFDIIHPDDLAHYREFFQEENQLPGVPIPYQLRLLHRNGYYISTEGMITNLLHDESVKAYILNFRDCTERKLAEMERTKMVDDIMQRNKELEQFSYIVSHNLRAPVANIIGLAKELNDDQLTLTEVKVVRQYLLHSAKQLDNVILDLNNVLQVKQEINENKEKVTLSIILEEIKSSISQIIRDENVDFIIDFSEGDELFTIKSYLHSVFYNLISNSIKYRQVAATPIIEIKSLKDGDKLIIYYKDNGLGIDLKKYGDQLFGLYKKFHHHVEGKGMGLFMVKTQLETLSAEISVESQVDQGTEFTIEFNCSK